VGDRPGLLTRLLELVDDATRPGAPPPTREALDRLRDAGTALADAEFVSLAHEAARGLDLRPIAHEAGAVGGVLPGRVTREELEEVDDAWGLAPRRTPPPAARPPAPPAPRASGDRPVRRVRTARDP
jgi:hypothetical protein